MTATDSDTIERRYLQSIEVTGAIARKLLVVSIAAFVAVVGIGDLVFARLGTPVQPVTITVGSPLEVLLGVAVIVGLLVVVVVPHELLHGVFMARYGGDPEYGIGVRGLLMPSAYARTRGSIYTRNQMLIVTLAPLVVITGGGFALAVITGRPLLVVPAAANAAGSVGDLWIATRVWRYPRSVRVAEPPAGYDGDVAVYGFADAERGESEVRSRAVATWLYGTAGTLTLAVAALFAAVIVSLSAGSGNVVLEIPLLDRTLFRHHLATPGGAFVAVGFPALFALSAVGGLVWTVVSRGRETGS
ncbi:DUF3267 domain-containing protein [Natrialbaceae archaeon A-gly3]